MKKLETQRKRLMEAAIKTSAHRLLLLCLMLNILLGLLIGTPTPGALSQSCFSCQAEKRAELTEENTEEISADKSLENDQHSSEEFEQEVHKEQPVTKAENNEGAQLSFADNSQPDEAQPPCSENNLLENTKQPSTDQLHHLTIALPLLGNPTFVKRNPESLIQTLSREMEVHNKDEVLSDKASDPIQFMEYSRLGHFFPTATPSKPIVHVDLLK
ncbi:hypothetical protein Nepgr_030786 [Nepenthes gracilis]|uniref:Uncharacterized protein n=1 Tax=Nepenthes gracilis TaxID=150966 RepID=A0AAD3TH78_NEPGR|nr:hypothetical protein Nepgr_030786 [Nepenthes gracilis]